MKSADLPNVSMFCFWVFSSYMDSSCYSNQEIGSLDPFLDQQPPVYSWKLHVIRNPHIEKYLLLSTHKYHIWLYISLRVKMRKVVQKIWHQRNAGIRDAYYSRGNYFTEKFAFWMTAHYSVISQVVIWPTHLLLHRKWAINSDSLKKFFFYYMPETQQNMHCFSHIAMTSINSK